MAYSKPPRGRTRSSGAAQKRRTTSSNQHSLSTGQKRQRQSSRSQSSAAGRSSSGRSGRSSSTARKSTSGRNGSASQRYDDFGGSEKYNRRRRTQTPGRRSTRRKAKKQKGCLGILIPILAAVLCIGVLFFAVRGGYKKVKESFSPTVLTEDVLAYEAEVAQQAKANAISEYTPILLCIMMQESKGKGTDPMQSSECIYNTRYERTADSIQEPSYSIECGVKYFADALDESRCTGLDDTNALMLAVQGYNFGHGYVSWALKNDGGYSLENAEEFSEMVQEEQGLSSYGDPEYAEKVMTFYRNSYESSEKSSD